VFERKIWGYLLLLFSPCIAADESNRSLAIAPFAVSNTNPFIIIHGLPVMEEASLLVSGNSSFQFHFDFTNNSFV
jgi:hypothetical protein